MSHFVVMVPVPGDVAFDKIEEEVTRRLQPYHEFECTGTDDEYVQDVDITQEAWDIYQKDTTTMVKCPDGTITSFYDETGNYKPEFCREEDDDFIKSHKRKVRHIPEGYEEIEVPTRNYESFEDFVKGYYGIDDGKYGRIEPIKGRKLDNAPTHRVIDRTNPNKKWDWWVIGGRWSGLFLPDGAQNDPNTPAFAQDLPEGGNIIRKGDWPYKVKAAEAAERYGRYWNDVRAAVDGLPPFRSFENLRDEMDMAPPLTREEAIAEMRERGGWDETDEDAVTRMIERSDPLRLVRKAYHEQPCVVAAKGVKRFDEPGSAVIDGWFPDYEEWLTGDRDSFIAKKAWSVVGTYAMLNLEGQWLAKGEMGWWGMDSNHDDNWPKPALDMLDALPDDTWLVAVDCHI